MNYLKTARVVVIDDSPDEAAVVIEALGRLGIGCIYLKGERLEDLPAQPLRGIRLVILDLRLGTTGTEKQIASATANVFRRVISADHGPLIVLLWTKHIEDVPAFKKALFEIEPKFRDNILVANLEKPATITDATLNRITKRIKALGGNWRPIDFLWQWEQLAHDAATETTATVAKQVSVNAEIAEEQSDEARRDQWLLALKRLLLRLVEAAGGRRANRKTANSDLIEALTAINDDRLELESFAAEPANLAVLFEQSSTVTPQQAGQLNRMVMIGSPFPGPQEIRPGNIYILGTNHGSFRPCGIRAAALKQEIITDLERDPQYKQQNDLAKKNAGNTSKAKAHKEARDKRRQELYKQCKVVIAEITPSCDFTQRNRKVVRLAAGVLVPYELERLVPAKKESLRVFDPIVLPNLNGLWRLVFSGRHLYTMPDLQKILTKRPAFRLRSNVLADLRDWYGSQGSRPGYLSLRPD